MFWHVEHGEALATLKDFPDNCVDAVVTDPPAGIAFMGKKWDGAKGGRTAWVAWLAAILAECLRVTKPGGRLLCWSIPRTMHWTGCAVEDAGWVVENTIAHIFGSGFPKAKSQLKPGREDWWLARKPGPKVLPLNIDECRIGMGVDRVSGGKQGSHPAPMSWGKATGRERPNGGRWPANVIFDEDAGAELDEQSGITTSGALKHEVPAYEGESNTGFLRGRSGPSNQHGDSGGASRFFYCAKASKTDRGDDCTHPTVKSTDLMQYLVRLVKPVGVANPYILDPFTGSGSTGRGAALEGCSFIGIEADLSYVEIARRRIGAVVP